MLGAVQAAGTELELDLLKPSSELEGHRCNDVLAGQSRRKVPKIIQPSRASLPQEFRLDKQRRGSRIGTEGRMDRFSRTCQPNSVILADVRGSTHAYDRFSNTFAGGGDVGISGRP